MSKYFSRKEIDKKIKNLKGGETLIFLSEVKDSKGFYIYVIDNISEQSLAVTFEELKSIKKILVNRHDI